MKKYHIYLKRTTEFTFTEEDFEEYLKDINYKNPSIEDYVYNYLDLDIHFDSFNEEFIDFDIEDSEDFTLLMKKYNIA